MLKIDQDSVNKFLELNNLLNNLEIRGNTNIQIMYQSILILQQILQKLQELNKKEEDGIVIDNTKKEG